LNDPFISEQGRKFPEDLLNQLSDQQIRDLFFVGRVEYLQEYAELDGVTRKITAEDWAEEFIKKREEINEARCSDETRAMFSKN
jgi:hypothetical protein